MSRLLIVAFFAALALCVPAQNAQAATLSSVENIKPQVCIPMDPMEPSLCIPDGSSEPQKSLEPPLVKWKASYKSAADGTVEVWRGQGLTCYDWFIGPKMTPPDPETNTVWTRVTDCEYTYNLT